jgi:hypothetical protein
MRGDSGLTLGLPLSALCGKVLAMENEWAAAQLQTIRTLMERSAVYRRALAPVMTMTGAVGLAAGLIGWRLRLDGPRVFLGFWIGVAVAAVAVAFVLIRRQALKESEPFWSPPTRRVAQAVLPAFAVGFILAAVAFQRAVVGGTDEAAESLALPSSAVWVTAAWLLLYGIALHAAGFFMPRGIRFLGWLFIAAGVGVLLLCTGCANADPRGGTQLGHLLMAGFFGGLQLLYGIYLYFTEKGTNAT